MNLSCFNVLTSTARQSIYCAYVYGIFQGLVPEALHAVGLTILTFAVLPYLDATLAVLAFLLVGIVPSVVDIVFKYIAIGSIKQESSELDRVTVAKPASNTNQANSQRQNHPEKDESDSQTRKCNIQVNWAKIKFVFGIIALVSNVI